MSKNYLFRRYFLYCSVKLYGLNLFDSEYRSASIKRCTIPFKTGEISLKFPKSPQNYCYHITFLKIHYERNDTYAKRIFFSSHMLIYASCKKPYNDDLAAIIIK